MTHRDTRILVVLVLALGSLSTGTAQVPEEIKQINQAVFKIQLRELPRRLQCEEGVCTSGYPNDEYDGLRRDGTPTYDCTTQYSNCEVLKLVRGSRWKSNSYQERILVDITQLAKVITRQHEQVLAASAALQRAIREMDLQPQGGQNATSQLLAELDTLRGRQAASAALQVVQFLLFIGYLLTLSIIYVVRQCKKHRERLAEEEVELIEQKLQERKAKRRAAAAKAKAVPGPNQE